MSSPLNENTSDVELLDMLDQTLRNGSNPTRANLVFDLLCDRLGFDRRQLPGYKADMKKLEEEDAALDQIEEVEEAPITDDERVWASGQECLCGHYRVTHTVHKDRCNALGCGCLVFTPLGAPR